MTYSFEKNLHKKNEKRFKIMEVIILKKKTKKKNKSYRISMFRKRFVKPCDSIF